MKEATPGSDQQRMQAVWGARARRLAKRPVHAADGHGVLPVIVLRVGQERYGVDLPDLAEVLPLVRPTPVPGAPAVFAGIINVHGEIRPVLDLRRLLGMETALKGALARVVLLRHEGREMGLRIDGVEQIRWIGSLDLEAPGQGARGSSAHVRGSTKDLLLLLSTAALFAELHTGVTT